MERTGQRVRDASSRAILEVSEASDTIFIRSDLSGGADDEDDEDLQGVFTTTTVQEPESAPASITESRNFTAAFPAFSQSVPEPSVPEPREADAATRHLGTGHIGKKSWNAS